jgi:hypothetical protein
MQTIALLATWAMVRVMVPRHLPITFYVMTGSRIPRDLQDLANPRHWPQLASAFGFLPPVVTVERRRLRPYAASASCGACGWPAGHFVPRGVDGGRIFDEYTLLMAVNTRC